MMEEQEPISFVDETFDVIPVGVINNIASNIAPTTTPEGTPTEGILQAETPAYNDLPPLASAQEIGIGVPEAIPQVPTIDFSEEELLDFSELLFNAPQMFHDRLPDRNPKQVARFNKILYRYCVKHGFKPEDYFMDEFGLIMSGGIIVWGIKKDYDYYYKGPGAENYVQDKPPTQDDKLNLDFNHKKELDEQKELDEWKIGKQLEKEENNTTNNMES